MTTAFEQSHSALYKSFISNQNKGLVWNLLAADGIFNTIPENKAQQVKEEFDRKFQTIAAQITSSDSILNLDKRVLSEMIIDLKKYAKVEEMSSGYNTAEISQQRQKAFEAELNTKKKDFDTFNSTPVPDKIDFSDVLDAPIGSEMDKILADQIALRERQLNMVLTTQEKDKGTAAKWIQNPLGQAGASNSDPPKLKIGENVQLDIKEPSTRSKKVNFADTNSGDESNDDFLRLLKKKETPLFAKKDEETLSLLREILETQKQILNLLIKN
jgi:hypothetical protein